MNILMGKVHSIKKNAVATIVSQRLNKKEEKTPSEIAIRRIVCPGMPREKNGSEAKKARILWGVGEVISNVS